MKKDKIENEIRVEILDIPYICDFNRKECLAFQEALSKVEDIQLFNNRAIKALIDLQWYIAKVQTVKYLFIPFLIYLALYVVYSNVLNG